MDILPSKSPKGIWTVVIIILFLVGVMFLNTYMGPNKQPLFGFLKKKNGTTTPTTTTPTV